ncbi:DUF6099 family protein [Kitasatospora sp. NPDC050543]|uniref:DUF6099 family protein n=1 Tax=Kitasatospora sp. NPDC050543 TaxID=3364054 RepID=UPI0037B27156
MDALRLIKTARHALAEARNVPDALAEAWQAGLLTEAVGGRLAEQEEGEVAALGHLLCEAGAHAASCLEQSPDGHGVDWGGAGRASRLTDLGALDPLLAELGRLLHDVAETLVVLACGADAESLYWTCIDGVDAGAECKELVAELHRAVRKTEAAAGETAGGVVDVEVGTQESGGPGGGPALGCAALSGAVVGGGALGGRVGSGAAAGRGPGPAGTGPAPAASPGRGLPILVVPLGPPVGDHYRPPGVAATSAEPATAAALAPEECSSAPSPAGSALTDASSSRICSSRLFGPACADCAGAAAGEDERAAETAGTTGVGRPVALGSCGAAGASDHGSDMREPLRLGGAR